MAKCSCADFAPIQQICEWLAVPPRREQSFNCCHQHRHACRLLEVDASAASKAVVAAIGDERDVAFFQTAAYLGAVVVIERMIQDGSGQGRVFNPKEGFVESAAPYHPRSFIFESQRDIECNEQLVLGDEASLERAFPATSSALLRKQESSHRHCKPDTGSAYKEARQPGLVHSEEQSASAA